MWEWLQENKALMGWLFAASIASLVLVAILLPVFVVRLPADYFVREREAKRGPRNVLWHVGKNLLGAVFLLAGLAMLVLPGQGLLTILIGLLMLDFPGKRGLERQLISRPPILKFVNGLRERRGRPPLQIDERNE